MRAFSDTDREFGQNVFLLAGPILLQWLLRISVDTVNSIMLGSVDQLLMAAMSQADQIFFIYHTICCGISVGACVLIAQYWGKRDTDTIRTILGTALRAVAVFGLVVTVLVAAFPELFMHIYSSDDELIVLGAQYLRTICLMYLPCGISVVIFAGCRGVEQVKVVFVTNLISYSVNIFLNYCMIFGRFGFEAMGIMGVATGAIVARLLELAICSFYLLRMEKRMNFRFRDLLRRDRVLGKDLVKVTAPIVGHEIVWSLGTSTGSMITGQLGTQVVAGYNVMMVLYNLCCCFGQGFQNGVGIVLGKTIGSGNRKKAEHQSRIALVWGLLIGLATALLFFLLRDPFLSLYRLEPEAVEYAKRFILIMVFIWPFSILEMTGMVGILRAGGDGKTGFITDCIVMWCICIPLAYLSAFVWKTSPVVTVSIIKTIIVLEGTVAVIRVLRMHWMRDLTRG